LTFVRKLVNRATVGVDLLSDHVTRTIRRDLVTEVMLPIKEQPYAFEGLTRSINTATNHLTALLWPHFKLRASLPHRKSP